MIRLTPLQAVVLLPYVLANADHLGVSAKIKQDLEDLLVSSMDLKAVFGRDLLRDKAPPGFLDALAELVEMGLMESAPLNVSMPVLNEDDMGWRATRAGEGVAMDFIYHYLATRDIQPNGALREKALHRALSDDDR